MHIDHRLLTDWTSDVVFEPLALALRVHPVATAIENTREDWIVHVFLTDRAVRFQSTLSALMVVLQAKRHTAVANITVKCVLTTTYTADTTFVAVEHTFLWGVIVVKHTNTAVVISKVFDTLDTWFWFWLFHVAAETFNCANFMSVKQVVKFRVKHWLKLFIVTQTTCVEFSFANRIWTLFHARSFVVFAAERIICHLVLGELRIIARLRFPAGIVLFPVVLV